MILATDRDKCAHLLRRFGLGASEAELDYYLQSGGINGAIAKLLDYESVDEAFPFVIDDMANQKDQVKMPGVQAWWLMRLVMTRRPLQEKMTLFWHDHFATSASKVNGPMLMYTQNEILRRNATGGFREMLGEVSRDPAMLYWLDNQYNVKGKPNENFAREVMELFTLGIGHYTEKDIQEAARAFTGWTFGRRRGARAQQNAPKNAAFYFNEDEHDDGVKTVLGKTGNLDGEAVLDVLCENPQTAKYVATKVWEWFAYPKPEQAIIDRLANTFRVSRLNIRTLVQAVMESPEFYSDKAVRAIYKNPVDFVVPPVRQLGFGQLLSQVKEAGGEARAQVGSVRGVQLSMKSMGMDLLFPPDVAGWMNGAEWITSATMIERIKFADRIYGQAPAGLKGQKGGANVNLRYTAYAVLHDTPTPDSAVRRLLSLYDAPVKADKLPALVAAANKASGGQITQANANVTAAAVTRLIFGTPEFQFA